MNLQPAPDRSARIRALLLDLDGVLVLRGRLLPGARESLARLDAAGFPYVIGTNMSIVSRATLAAEMAKGGLAVPVERILTASSAAAAYAARHFRGQPVFVMGTPDALEEFRGQRVIGYEEAADPSVRVAAVVVGDAGEAFTARNMQSAFRLIREGAAFVAMHKNRWWLTPQGTRLDSGAYVHALEFGTEKRAVVTGKPNAAFFREGMRCLRELAGGRPASAEIAPADIAMVGDDGRRIAPADIAMVGDDGRRIAPADIAMVGDDLWNDLKGARAVGMRAIFVRSGKHGDEDLARWAAERSGGSPDFDFPSIVEVVDACLAER